MNSMKKLLFIILSMSYCLPALAVVQGPTTPLNVPTTLPGQNEKPPMYGYGPGNGNINAGPAVSEDDAHAMQEINKMVEDIENYKNTLPEADRIKFDKEVNETAARIQTRMDDMLKNDPTLEDRVKNQDPEALDMFFQNVFGPEIERAAQEDEAFRAQQQAEAPIQPGPSAPDQAGPSLAEKPEKKQIKEPKKVDTKAALELIESIIEYLESFKDKMNIIISFQGLYEKWAQEGRLKGWTKDLNWEKYKEKVDLLTKTFYELKLKDPDTKQYRHLPDLLENESLFAEIKQFNENLSENEPRINVPEAGIGTLNSASKDAARQTINICLQGITKLQEKLTALMAKYEKTAKKIGEEKEKARQKAEQAIKQRRPGYTHPIGVGEREGYAPYYQEPVGPYTSYTPWTEPSAPQKTTLPEKPEEKKPEPPKGGPRAPAAKQEKKGDEHEQAIDRALEQFTDDLTEIGFSIQDNEHLKNFGEYMTKPSVVDSAAATTSNEIQAKINNAAKLVRRIGVVHFPYLAPSAKNDYIKKFENAIDKDEQTAPLRKLIGDIESIDKARGGVSQIKQFAFFDEQTRQALNEAQKKQQDEQAAAAKKEAAKHPGTAAPEPKAPVDEYATARGATTSIFTLRDAFKRLKESIQNLKTIQQKVGAKKQASGGRPETRQAGEGVAE